MKSGIILLICAVIMSCTTSLSPIEDSTPTENRSVLPDLSPEHAAGSTSYLYNQSKIVVVRLRNFGGPTTAPVVFDVIRMDSTIMITWDSTLTSVSNPNAWVLNNSDWTVQQQATRWRFTSKPGVVITSTNNIGLIFTARAYGNASWNTIVKAGTGGGETPTNNNIKITHLTTQ